MRRRRIVLCGGSSGTHVLVADLARRPDWDVRVLTSRPDSWSNMVTCFESGGMSEAYPLFFRGRESQYSGQAYQAFGWNDASEALSGADAVFLVCPVHAHRDILSQVLPALDPNSPVTIGSLYAQGGFDWIVRDIIASQRLALNKATFFGLKRYPYVCRQREYGRSVTLFGRFPRLAVAMRAPNEESRVHTERLLNDIFERPVRRLPSFLSCTLNMSNQILHPGLSWGHFHDYVPGNTYPHRKLLYGHAEPVGTGATEDLFQDLVGLVRALQRVTGQSLLRHLGADPLMGSLAQIRLRLGMDKLRWRPLRAMIDRVSASVLRSNERLRHVPAPMIAADSPLEGYVPDFGSRFWEDDIGHGLCVLYGLGRLVDLPMRHTGTMICRQQRFMRRNLIVDGDFGPDFDQTNAPQRYGITDSRGLKSFLEW